MGRITELEACRPTHHCLPASGILNAALMQYVCCKDRPRVDCFTQIAGYPPDEAATREKMEYRLEKAGNLFMVAVSGATDAIIGYVCATATAKEQLEEESMSVHDPDGTTACIHSVCVATEQRRKGVATRMLKSYIQWVQQTSRDITNMQLICKEHTVRSACLTQRLARLCHWPFSDSANMSTLDASADCAVCGRGVPNDRALQGGSWH